MASEAVAYTSRVLVNGTERGAFSWSDDRELSGNLPAQIVAGSGIAQATGNIDWTSAEDASDSNPTPWNPSGGWLPKSGDRVEIYSGDEAGEARVFTGLVDATNGDVGSGFQSTLIDDFDKLSAPFEHVALHRTMPPTVSGGARRGIGLSYLYIVDAALRTAGFYATPAVESRSALSVPMQSSMWPETGSLTGGRVTVEAWAIKRNAPWGVAMSNVRNEYTPRTFLPLTTATQVTLMVAPEHSGDASVIVSFGAVTVSIFIDASRTAIARLSGNVVCTLPLGDATMLTLLAKGTTWTLKTNTGAAATGNTSAPGSSAMSKVTIEADTASRIAAVQVSHPTAAQEFASLTYRKTANYRLGLFTYLGVLDATPLIMSTVEEILTEISEATLSAMWIDEEGVFQWATPNALAGQASSETLTTLNDIFALSWSDSLLASRSKIIVSYQQPAITNSLYRNVTLVEPTAKVMESREVSEEFIAPASDEDWIMPDTNMSIVKTGSWFTYNARRGTVGGGIFTSTGDETSDVGLTFTVALEVVDLRTMKITHTVGDLPSGVQFETVTSPVEGTVLWPRLRDKPLPVIRGFGRTQWVDQKLAAVDTGAPGPALEHDLKAWNSRTEGNATVAERYRDYLVDQLAKPMAVITGLEVTYDPLRKLGSVVTIRSDDLLGIELKCLLVGMSRSAGSTYTQSLSVKIISATSLHTTYAAWNAAGGETLTYQQWNAIAPTPRTYAAFNTDT